MHYIPAGALRFAKKLLITVAALSAGVGLVSTSSAKIFDGGVDSENLGKGEWIFSMTSATNRLGGNVPGVNDIPSLMSYQKNQGMTHIIVKAGTGSTNYLPFGYTSPQFTSNLVYQAHVVGLKIFAYTRSYGDDVPGEIALATNCYNLGADGFIIDAEVEWESGRLGTNGPSRAMQLGAGIKAVFPNKFLGHSPLPYISLHSSFPYKEFGYYCDAVMPQDYWYSLNKTPAQMVLDMESQWHNWQNSLSGQWTNAIKPIAPIGQADDTNIPPSDILAFTEALKASTNPITPSGYKSISWWRADLHRSNHWVAIGASTIGNPPAIPDVIVDNPAAIVVGTWTTASSAADKYGADYRFKGKGTGTAWLQWTPTIVTPGFYQVYVMYSAGSNRTTNAPYTLTHKNGTETFLLNQKTLGGSWRPLGTFEFNAGTAGTIVLSDNFPDAGQLVMADAVRFAYVLPPPAAPSGLTATAAAGPNITLNWADNSSDEGNFIVARSTTSGGPYTDVGSVASGVTTWTDALLAADTTYYYVVRSASAGGSSANSNEASATSTGDVADIILDNGAGTPTGNWLTGSGSADKFGVDYRYKSQGTGAAFMTFAPNILTPGDYQISEWHPQGSNRTAGAPYIISHSGGSTTLFVNQQVDGGKWNLLGSFNLPSGSVSYVRITDGFADAGQLVMADAIKFSYVTIPAPTAPSGLAATTISKSQINLSWTDNSNNEDNFVVASSMTIGGPYSVLATLPGDSTAFSDGGLSANTTYYYVVRAANDGGISADSAEASATTLPTVPSAPGDLTATVVGQNQINLSWTDNASNEDNLVLARGDSSGGPYADIAILNANTTSFSDIGLSAATTYYYVVRAINSGGSSANSAEATATTLPFPPAAPDALTATVVSQTQINLSWADNSSNEDQFIVARSTTIGGPYANVAVTAPNVTSFADTGLVDSTPYYYVVRAINAGGPSANSAEVGATTLPFPPVAPSGLVASTLNQVQINLTWSDNSANESGFTIARSTVSGGPYTEIALIPANTTFWNDSGLSPGTTYYYVVRASNAGGNSAYSAQASATTVPLAPNAPGPLSAVAYSANQINLSWVDNSSNENNFIVARSTAVGGPYTTIATLGANATSYSNTSLTANTTYYYVVRAVNAGGTSANSTEANTTTFETDLIIDNRSAVVVGSWLVGTASADKYGADYRYKGTGTGANHLQFTPYVATTGIYEVYEWHSQGANRVAAGAHVISYNGGSQTILVNQQANGGKWNLLGTFNFAAGAAGNVRITDNFTGTNIVVADAIKLVYIAPPAAPTALFANAISGSQINLNWTDNSANESNFVVSRSTTSGGPYTDIATLPANTVAYNNTGLATGTTYYYVVRATGAGGASVNSAQATASTVPGEIVIDNPAATVVGTWTTTTTSADKFGADYRFKGIGTGTAYLQFSPNITTAGIYQVYEWHPAGSNRSTNTPHVITYTGGSQTVKVNQQLNGGKWNLLGTFGFVAGSGGNVKITDAFTVSGQSAMADAIRFVYAGPLPPAAPTGLTASPVSGTQIALGWTDNATTETGYVVARATASGGPYTDIATLGANVTSYTNAALVRGTAYYYVVRAINSGGSSANSNQASTTIPAEIIIDNPAASAVGTWSTASTSTDKFGADYRFKSKGTGTAYLQFTPNLPVAGRYEVYEWHSIGSNRAIAAAHVVSYSGGSQTVTANQQINGGTWNLLGTFSFAAGVSGNIRINDNFATGTIVIADAVRVVYVSP